EDGDPVSHTFKIDEEDTLHDVAKKIGDASEKKVRAFYDENSNHIVLETTRTGVYNTNEEKGGAEITFDEDNDFFTDLFSIPASGMPNESGPSLKAATDAEFTYNEGLKLTSRSNSYTLNGVMFQFNNT